MKKAFTLIELLVVVLIIGILSAIALPQYQKAVKKAKMAQLDVIYNTAKKAIDVYLLSQNTAPVGTVRFTGTNSISDISLPGNCKDNTSWCYTNVGRIRAQCVSGACSITIDFAYNLNGDKENEWFSSEDVHMYFEKEGNQDWRIKYVMKRGEGAGQPFPEEGKNLLCSWLEKYYSTDETFIANCR